ncbi:MAG: 4,5-DOPA dioxygenase extradiol [Planctomycetota bacterium]
MHRSEPPADPRETGSVPIPAVFFGHGSPMNAIEQNRYSRAWAEFGRAIPVPRAILVISAHWYGDGIAVTAMPKPRTIHDFHGFPRRLFGVEYPAPGSPELAHEVVDLLAPMPVRLDLDDWGLDHGTWSVLVHACPRADIPVVQLSLDSRLDFDAHFALGARLAPLRERGVWIVGSGNVVHNLRALEWSQPELGFDWARRFDEAVREVLTERPEAAPALRHHADFALAVPTPDHFLPLLYLAGLSSAAKHPLSGRLDGFAYGSLSMACYSLESRSV